MYDEAFGVLCRKHIPSDGGVPFSTLAAGVSVHRSGIILTALHCIENFVQQFSIYDAEEARALARAGVELQSEPQERPHFMFLHTLRRGGGVNPGTGLRQVHVFGIHHVHGDKKYDVAAMAISPTEEYRPLPALSLARMPACEGQEVYFLGHHHPKGTLADPAGYPAGMAVSYSKGKVARVLPDRILFSGDTVKGMSGGPVVDSESRLLGVITEIWPAALAAQRLGLATQLTSAVPIEKAMPSLLRVAHHEDLPADFGFA